ncbi:hypothetical protein J437_LFUL018768 [Ladona fulva]|uniref:Abasic site processing protein HMCES n=1 Tax=Ladona fulva TaxID=123851 RepID=A0A8K0PD91_LADFU|nr:hypothetical protein J437_LFUL018768 [Ladona fulva]
MLCSRRRYGRYFNYFEDIDSMCGRAACTLDPDNICKACSFKDPNTKKYYAPQWINFNDNWNYKPSHNLAPTDVFPVLVSGKHFPNSVSTNEAVIHPMIWGMIPPWHKGSINDHKLTTHNCRLEHITESRLYSEPLRHGSRCAMICDGFYEWQTTRGSRRQPYFIFAPQDSGVKIEDESTWENSWSEEKGWHGPKLLKIAGLFNTWKSAEGKTLYSFTIITMESNESLSWCHHRMPAILDKEEDVANWLDFGKVTLKSALNLLQPVKCLSWYLVDTLVNNSRNKDPLCNKPLTTVKKSASSNLLTSWLKRKEENKERSQEDGVTSSKLMKVVNIENE